VSARSGPGYAFLSYAREDAKAVDRIQERLHNEGVTVWRDINDLWPGQDWKTEIRKAITRGTLAFIAFFSQAAVRRTKSHMREELLLAVDEFRARPPGRPWLIPVRLEDCELPDLDLGMGRTLDSIQRVDLFGQARERQTDRLIATVAQLVTVSLSNADRDRLNVATAEALNDSWVIAPFELNWIAVATGTDTAPRVTARVTYGVHEIEADATGNNMVEAVCIAAAKAAAVDARLMTYQVSVIKDAAGRESAQVTVLVDLDGDHWAARGEGAEIPHAAGVAFLRAINRALEASPSLLELVETALQN
jgi:hypothetical protein